MSDSVRPLQRPRKVKKTQSPFNRWQSDRFMRVKPNWRRPRGIDSRIRRQFRGTPRMPKIGYRTAKATRGLLPNGFRKFRVNNVKDLDLLLMHNRTYAAEIAHAVSVRTRIAIIARAKQLNIKVLNKKARVESADQA